MRKRGRHANDRLRAMRFALWAQHVPPHLMTIKQIGGLLDLNKTTAAKWRKDWFLATSPIEIDGVPGYLTPDPRELPSSRPAATDQTPPTTRS